jgi:hypothetical protein
MNQDAPFLPRRGNGFPLSPGERAGVRVSVKLIIPKAFHQTRARSIQNRLRFRKLIIQVPRRADQRNVRQRLRKIAQMFAARAELLGI